MERRTCTVSIVLALLLVPVRVPAAPQDIATLISRFRADTLGSTATSSAASYLSSQQSDGCWSDVSYTDTSRTGWAPNTHLSRMLSMAVAYHTPGHASHQSSSMLAGVMKGIDCWVAKAPKSDNWWWNDIGKQLKLGPIGLVMDAELDTSHRAAIVAQLPTTPSMTGQNRVWISQGVVQRGCLEKSETRINTGIAGIKGTIVVGTGEGIQPDWSFHQHGAQLYNAGYGQGFIRDASYWANRTRGTVFAFTAAQVDTLTSLLLDGDRWMVRGQMFDYSADGRELSRKGQSSSGLAGPCDDLASINSARSAELTALRDHIQGKGAPVSGNRHFWRSDFMAHQRPAFYASVKMCSVRTVGTECVNDENILGYWLPFGLTYIARRGDEYKDIFPVWDWTLLPGVTAPAWTDRPNKQTQSVDYAGGASNGAIGVAAMALDKASTTARKAWFLFEDELVALGAGITSTHAKPVRTALNQCLLGGAVTADGAVLAKGKHALASAHWVHHDGLGYVLPEKGPLQLENDARSGSWKAINLTGSSATVTLDVFTLWLEHGAQPKDQAYRYIVVPKASAAEVAAYAASPPVEVLVNTTARQAVRHAALGTSGVAFHQAGSVTLHAGLTAAADQPCVVIVDESGAAPEVTVADPTAKLVAVKITLSRPGEPDETLAFTLPAGESAGRSATQKGKPAPVPDQGAGPSPDGATRADASDGPAVDAGPLEAGGEHPDTLAGGCGCELGGAARGEGRLASLFLLPLLLLIRPAQGRPTRRRSTSPP